MFVVACATASAQTSLRVTGTVFDPAGRPLAGAHVSLRSADRTQSETVTGTSGDFHFYSLAAAVYTMRVDAAGFASLTRTIHLTSIASVIELRLEKVDPATEQIIVSADVGEVDLANPDPAQKVMVREELIFGSIPFLAPPRLPSQGW